MLHTCSGRHYLKPQERVFFCVSLVFYRWVTLGLFDRGGGNPGCLDNKLKNRNPNLGVLDNAFQLVYAKFRGLTAKNGVTKSRGANFVRLGLNPF